MKHLWICAIATLAVFVASCSGEDRSGEQPFAPELSILAPVVVDSTATFEAKVLSSRNSRLNACGFIYGNQLSEHDIKCTPAEQFSAKVDSLDKGRYYVVAYARNGIGTTKTDTLYFEIR